MKTAGLIVAAGRGHRTGGSIPKQYQMLGGKSVLRRTIDAMLTNHAVGKLLIVIHQDDVELYTQAIEGIDDSRLLPHAIGASERFQSVLSGLEALREKAPDKVLIHDAARPLLKPELIDSVLLALEKHQAALPAIPIVDALWNETDMRAISSQPRENLWRAQTPQGFNFDTIYQLHRTNTDWVADDVALARKAGIDVAIVPGDIENFKITLAEDFARAENLIGKQVDVRTGTGFDVHALIKGNGVILCGVKIPCEFALKGHSDADVAMHAITDAIFGALAEGDIGQWFPPSDAQWKGAASEIFLKKAVERTVIKEFKISHLDCTIICEHPKIGPHARVMREEIARITNLPIERVSVKATTSERLGFTGRGEGIAAQAIATLVQK